MMLLLHFILLLLHLSCTLCRRAITSLLAVAFMPVDRDSVSVFLSTPIIFGDCTPVFLMVPLLCFLMVLFLSVEGNLCRLVIWCRTLCSEITVVVFCQFYSCAGTLVFYVLLVCIWNRSVDQLWWTVALYHLMRHHHFLCYCNHYILVLWFVAVAFV